MFCWFCFFSSLLHGITNFPLRSWLNTFFPSILCSSNGNYTLYPKTCSFSKESLHFIQVEVEDLMFCLEPRHAAALLEVNNEVVQILFVINA